MKYFKLVVKIFLIVILIFLVIRFFSKNVIEGARGKRKKRRIWKKRQNKIKERINSVSSGYGNISNCAISYGDSLQLSEQTGLFNIFGNDKIIQCKGETPKLMRAKRRSQFPPGINLIPSDSSSSTTNSTSHIRYGDKVGLCGTSNIYKLINTNDVDSTEKVKYSDYIQMTPISDPSGTLFNVTVNPNVYELPNVRNLTSTDFTNIYVNNYAYCGDSTSGGVIMATDD